MGSNEDNETLGLGLEGKRQFEIELEREFEKAEEKSIEEASELFFHLKDWGRTAKILEERELYLTAAFTFKKAGNLEKAKENFIKAAQIFENKGLYPKAAHIYEKIGDLEKAVQIMVNCFNYNKAAAYYGKDMSDLDEYLIKIVGLYLKLDNLKKAYQLLILEEKYEMAADLLIKHGRLEKAAVLLEKAQHPLKAADVYEKIGNAKKAYLLRAEEALRLNNSLEAAEWYAKAEDFIMAARYFQSASEWRKAAECYSRINSYSHAAECYLKNSDEKEAVKMFELEGEWETAADVLYNLKEYKKAGEYYERCGNYYKAGNSFSKYNDNERAVINFQKVPNTSLDYFDSVIQVTNFFLKDKKAELVITKLEKLLDKDIPGKSLIELFYNLGQAYEDIGKLEKASEIYKKILEEDYHFRDVQQRLKEVERLTEKYKSMKLERDDASKRYKMISEAGEGGMGTVFKAEDLYLQRIVAIKVLKENLTKNKESFDMFYKEAKAAATLSHPNIVKVFDFGQMNEDYFISMEFLEGEDLNSILKKEKLFPIEQILAITKKIAKALFYAHERGIIHRDIKPHNIILTKDNELKITDFGLASIKGQHDIEQNEYITGTPFYMSPEQILREEIDHRTDLYSTGVTLFHLITGDVPFKGKEVLFHHLTNPVPSIKKIRPEVPDLMVKIVEKCMEKKPVDRYNNAKEIVDEVKKIELTTPKSSSFDFHDSAIPTDLIRNIDKEDDSASTPTEAISDTDNVIGDDEAPTIASEDSGIIIRINDTPGDDDTPTIVSKDPGEK